eukprot:gene9642-9802_t
MVERQLVMLPRGQQVQAASALGLECWASQVMAADAGQVRARLFLLFLYKENGIFALKCPSEVVLEDGGRFAFLVDAHSLVHW